MPKKSITIKDFKGGIIPSDSFSDDNPINSLAAGCNIDFNNEKGRIIISGAFEKLQRPNVVTDVLEDYITPNYFKGCRGRGVFYFTSDYDNLVNHSASQPFTYFSDWDDVDQTYGPNFRVGPQASRNKPTSYFVVASRSHSNRDTDNGYNLGHPDAVLHIYEEAHDGFNRTVPDGSYNGWLTDIGMGHEDPDRSDGSGAAQGSNAYDQNNDPEYMRDWFPVYHHVNGGLRICDGSFNRENYNIITIEYIDDRMPFAYTATAIDGTGGHDNYQTFKVNAWVIARHNIATGALGRHREAGLPGPKHFVAVREYRDNVDASSDVYFNGTDTIFNHTSTAANSES